MSRSHSINAHVLVVDDEPLLRQSLEGALQEEGYQVSAAASGAEALARFQAERPDLVLLDLVLGDADGMDLLLRMRQEAPETKVLLITAHGSIKTAVAAMKQGAHDFIKKPFELDEVLGAVAGALRVSSLERRVEYEGRRRAGREAPVYRSAAMRRVLAEVALYAHNPVPVVLLLGESGTGKQLLGRRLHDESPRRDGPFVELNCSAIPDNLVESELFGHERGAFSDARERKLGLVEIADGGTLLLDEIGDLGAGAQAKLLTFLEGQRFRRVGATALRQVDARIVAATNRDLGRMVAERSFREDLYYRLSAMTVLVPPLRERPEDIGPLAEHFLSEAKRMYRRRWRGLSPEAAALLGRYRWPGNVRELRAVVHRAALLHDDEVLRPEHLPAELLAAALAAPELPRGERPAVGGAIAGLPSLEEMELRYIGQVLELCGGNRTLAAQHLGITRQTLTKRLGGAEDA